MTSTAVAIITLIGGVLAALAIHGVDLAGINALASMVGERTIYLTLLGATSLLLIDVGLITALIRHYSNKQLSQKEINELKIEKLSLDRYVQKYHILDILEPGEYWGFKTNENIHAAIAIVRNYNGSPGFYPFRFEDDVHAKIMKLDYEDCQLCATEKEMIEGISQKDRLQFNEWSNKEIEDASITTFNCSILQENKRFLIYAVRGKENGQEFCLYFKSKYKRDLLLGDKTNTDVAIKLNDYKNEDEQIAVRMSIAANEQQTTQTSHCVLFRYPYEGKEHLIDKEIEHLVVVNEKGEVKRSEYISNKQLDERLKQIKLPDPSDTFKTLSKIDPKETKYIQNFDSDRPLVVEKGKLHRWKNPGMSCWGLAYKHDKEIVTQYFRTEKQREQFIKENFQLKD